jgi:hypothetical protein
MGKENQVMYVDFDPIFILKERKKSCYKTGLYRFCTALKFPLGGFRGSFYRVLIHLIVRKQPILFNKHDLSQPPQRGGVRRSEACFFRSCTALIPLFYFLKSKFYII